MLKLHLSFKLNVVAAFVKLFLQLNNINNYTLNTII